MSYISPNNNIIMYQYPLTCKKCGITFNIRTCVRPKNWKLGYKGTTTCTECIDKQKI